MVREERVGHRTGARTDCKDATVSVGVRCSEVSKGTRELVARRRVLRPVVAELPKQPSGIDGHDVVAVDPHPIALLGIGGSELLLEQHVTIDATDTREVRGTPRVGLLHESVDVAVASLGCVGHHLVVRLAAPGAHGTAHGVALIAEIGRPERSAVLHGDERQRVVARAVFGDMGRVERPIRRSQALTTARDALMRRRSCSDAGRGQRTCVHARVDVLERRSLLRAAAVGERHGVVTERRDPSGQHGGHEVTRPGRGFRRHVGVGRPRRDEPEH